MLRINIIDFFQGLEMSLQTHGFGEKWNCSLAFRESRYAEMQTSARWKNEII